MSCDARFEEEAQALGHRFDGEIKIGGNYVPLVRDGRQIYLSGQIPRVGDTVVVTGAVGAHAHLGRRAATAQERLGRGGPDRRRGLNARRPGGHRPSGACGWAARARARPSTGWICPGNAAWLAGFIGSPAMTRHSWSAAGCPTPSGGCAAPADQALGARACQGLMLCGCRQPREINRPAVR
ncbi:hypothetical protein AVHM3334_05820 [Acidovorax sp. SUPP3334]|nr:hypothetical protein AVHM3334_05820 [Acidovorax sp. SUPP3334]